MTGSLTGRQRSGVSGQASAVRRELRESDLSYAEPPTHRSGSFTQVAQLVAAIREVVARDILYRRLPARSAMVAGALLNRRHIDECFEETPTGQVAQLVAAIREVVARDFLYRRLPSRSAMVVGAILNRRHIGDAR